MRGGYTRDNGDPEKERLSLEGQAEQWPTPTVPNGGRVNPVGTSLTGMTPDGRKKQVGLEEIAKSWPTPAARDYRTPNSAESQDERNAGSERGQQLQNFVEHCLPSPLAQAIPAGSTSLPARRASRRRLNPVFVEWLMGWPPMWT